MAVYKEEKTNTWRVLYRYTDWKDNAILSADLAERRTWR